MIAEALGSGCQFVGKAWHAWDLQIGDSGKLFPERIRIQVKNTAHLQDWHVADGKRSACSWRLKFQFRPFYFQDYNPNIPCEDYGFMCDAYILCLHDSDDLLTADQREPGQWKFYILPVIGRNSAVTVAEREWAAKQLKLRGKPVNLERRPATLEKGIRGRPPISPVSIEDLTVDTVRTALIGSS